MDLLLRCPVGPVGRNVVGRQLHPDSRFAVDDHHVPVILSIDRPIEHSGPEAALGLEVFCVEYHHLASDAHRGTLSGDQVVYGDARRRPA